MRKIPLDAVFLERLNKTFGESTAQKIMKGFSADRFSAIRVNTLKTNVREIMSYFKEINVKFERVGFLPDALVILNKKEKFFEDLDIYAGGKIYFQGIFSQIPVKFLDPAPGEKILDMCAAPGSKTTQIAAMMQNTGKITANEINMIRMERLKYNLNKQGVAIANVISYDGTVLGDMYHAKFDKILLDAPCSAEGRINFKNPRSYKFWSEKVVKNCAKLQKKLIVSAVKALKSGGVLVYSTCTLANEENDEVVRFALESFPGVLAVEKISLDFKYVLRSRYGLIAIPSEICEGFFAARMRKG